MQSVHKDLHKMKIAHGNDIDAIPYVAANIAERSSVLCFDEFQCTDVADAMILRRLMEALMAHGTVIVTTSNRHPDDLYKNGIERESFIPCINLLKRRLTVLNLDSQTDYRKIPRPPSGVYHHPLDASAKTHAERWFRFLGDFEHFAWVLLTPGAFVFGDMLLEKALILLSLSGTVAQAVHNSYFFCSGLPYLSSQL